MKWKRADVDDRSVCMAYRDKQWPWTADALLSERFPGCPMKVIWSAMDRAYGRGYLEYGTNIRSGWLTNKGKKILDVDAGAD